ncbi:hypothetical protein CCR75_007006 [Bremia lactucae]|uniref:Uncharacterized protein n=1 Tax=Bremia lactucae TaxID=4779 RepID=A0A976FGW2_BRELC|nr:hypothetical protein CCR75_007006 [Bremia lactucae]
MEKDINADQDSLAALEAEYAKVLGNLTLNEISSQLPQAKDVNCDSEEDQGVGENYVLLPSSPCHSDDTLLDDRKEDILEEHITKKKNETNIQVDQRAFIMQSMQQLKLRPPPWAEAYNLSDDKLINMVQKQLKRKTSEK